MHSSWAYLTALEAQPTTKGSTGHGDPASLVFALGDLRGEHCAPEASRHVGLGDVEGDEIGVDEGHDQTPASDRTTCRSTSAPAVTSTGDVNSAMLCERPFTLGTKIIDVGQRRASIWAS
ncbi:MAG: hypothetical protein RLZ04_1505 [Actinomycetota bacterium]